MYYSFRCGDEHSTLELYNSSQVGVGRVSTSSTIGDGGGDALKKVLEYLVHCVDTFAKADNGNISASSSTTATKDERYIGMSSRNKYGRRSSDIHWRND